MLRKSAYFLSAILFIAVIGAASSAQQLSQKLQYAVGKWQVMNNDGTLGGQVETSIVDGKLVGKVIKLRPGKPVGSLCDLCSGDYKNKPMLGLTIMWNLKPDGDMWVDGIILDPDNGKRYKSKLWVIDKDHLMMRGFVGISLLGRTSNWVRIP